MFAGVIALVLLLAMCNEQPVEPQIAVIKQLDGAAGNKHYVGNRPPLAPSPLVKLPVGAVRARGWLHRQLQLEAEGFTGHLEQLSGFLRKEGNAWLDPQGEGHSHWEEVPYWLKGYIDLGYLLENERIIAEAHQWVEATIAARRNDGWFGPRANLQGWRSGAAGKPDLWPNMIMLNVLQSYHERTGDPRVVDLMTAYFHWQLAVPDDDFLPPYWQQQRAGDNLASVYWLYNRTGDEKLLELATKIHRNMAPWWREVPNWHGVNICQCFRAPAIYSMQSHDGDHLHAAERNYQTVMRMYGQVPGGMFGADENCRPGYSDPRQAAESCSMAELMLSCEMLLGITGQTIWADRCEDVAANSFPACMTADLKALHYLTAPNMPLCDARSKSPGLQNSGPMLLFDPRGHRCCQHNIAHAWPRFAQHTWMAAPGDGLAAVLYAPSQVTAIVGPGRQVTVTENTHYPFDETVELVFWLPQPARFPLLLRVPGWCSQAGVALNGKPLAVDAPAGSFLRLDRTWQEGDRLVLTLPMPVRLVRWKDNGNSASVYRGPLAFSLRIGETFVRAGGTDQWPAWEIYPNTPWNYGLVLEDDDPAGSFQVVERPWPGDEQPFEATVAPLELLAPAKRICKWTLDHLGLVGPLTESPVASDQPTETVTLIPMGCARLRIAAFPVIGTGPDAHDWVAPRSDTPWSASHCWHGDTVFAIDDGLVPRSSGDRSIPRFTWWDHRGTTEWVCCTFPQTRTVSRLEVYWFDDTGAGHCRVPAAWHVEWFDGHKWQPVETEQSYGVERDTFNCVQFKPVTAEKLRLVVQLQPEYSGGILECRIQ